MQLLNVVIISMKITKVSINQTTYGAQESALLIEVYTILGSRVIVIMGIFCKNNKNEIDHLQN